MITTMVESFRSYLRNKNAEIALAGLSDAALEDIGLTRAGLAHRRTRPEPAHGEAVRDSGSSFALPLPFLGTAQAA